MSRDLSARIAALPPTERAMVELIVGRLEMGLAQYGPWKLDDGRDLRRETLHEAIDGMAYVAALMLREAR